MDDHKVYLEKLSAFSRILRTEGFAVSPKETEDAASILTLLGFSDREQVKTALRTVYAKSREQQLRFDLAFDGFFLSEEAIRQQAQQHAEEDAARQQRKDAAQEELDQLEDRVHLSAEQKETYSLMSDEARQKLKSFMNKYKGSAERNPKLYSEFIHSVFTKTILEQQMMLENAGIGCEQTDPELGLLYRDISEFQEHEMPKAVELIQTAARQINGELSAKRKAHGHSGRLNFRKTIRKGLETGGTFQNLCYQRKRQRRRSLVILCDVSGSMVQFSEFVLRFIQSLNQVSEHSRIFLFSEFLTEADPFRLQNMDQFRRYVRESGIFGRGTDLGTALESLCRMQPGVLTSATTLLILSDTKTINQGHAIDMLQKAKQLSGRVLWMNPIPERKWKYLRSVIATASVCTMLPCSTLQELAQGCRKLTNEL